MTGAIEILPSQQMAGDFVWEFQATHHLHDNKGKRTYRVLQHHQDLHITENMHGTLQNENRPSDNYVTISQDVQ